MDVILRGPLVEAIAREVAHHAVVERTLTEILDAATSAGPPAQRRAVAGVELERAARAALDSGRMQQAIARALESADADELIGTILESPLLDSVVDHLLASDALWRLVEEIVASPAVMAAISQQGLGFIDQVGEETRRRSRKADAWLEDVARRLAHRRPNSLAASEHQSRDDPEQ